MVFGEPCVFSNSDFCISGLEYRYALVVPVPRFLAGIRVSVLLGEYRYRLELVPVPFESRIGTARPNVAPEFLTGVLISVRAFEYRYGPSEISYWNLLKYDSLHFSPCFCHV
ncbi:hypothetical protein V6N13_061086 [Hibiscus sabdariffa]